MSTASLLEGRLEASEEVERSRYSGKDPPLGCPHAAKRQAQSAKRKTLNVTIPSICKLCAMRHALCDLTCPDDQVF
ncbi:MAG: hypothetical protein LJE87_09225, partial [Deltaproteobacteria bacterium]|nr:hypothetical protein [Deltaproteobacteria bacterium]